MYTLLIMVTEVNDIMCIVEFRVSTHEFSKFRSVTTRRQLNSLLFSFQVLAESDQIRRDADCLGPRDELQFWRRRVIKFGHVIGELKGQKVKAAIAVLQLSSSRLIAVCSADVECTKKSTSC